MLAVPKARKRRYAHSIAKVRQSNRSDFLIVSLLQNLEETDEVKR